MFMQVIGPLIVGKLISITCLFISVQAIGPLSVGKSINIIIIIISQIETLTGKHLAIYPRAPAGKSTR